MSELAYEFEDSEEDYQAALEDDGFEELLRDCD